MHDLKWIRENAETFDKAMEKRGLSPQAETIIQLDKDRREAETKLQELQQERNAINKQIGAKRGKGEDAAELMEQAKEVNTQLEQLKEQYEGNDTLFDTLSRLPNILDDEVPNGKDEEDNKVIDTWGEIPEFSFTPKPHYELGEQLGLMDFEQTAKVSGSRFVTLTGELAQMERALAQFMLDTHTKEFEFLETAPPFLVRNEAMFGAGQLPKFADESYETTNHFRLIPTAEVALINLVADQIVFEETLPRRYVAYTPCFRSEAGAAGKDTRGMIRQHQFSKVELVSISIPEDSEYEHETIRKAAETILQKLKLPYQVVLLCSGDTGFSARKTFDLEVWLPGQEKYREISSISNCHDFQARRMKARCKVEGQKENRFVHTLNGSGLALGRTLVAVLENYQNEDGSITIPEVLRPYMNNKERIEVTQK